MTDQLMSLETIKKVESYSTRHSSGTLVMVDTDVFLNLVETARAAHEWKAKCETFSPLATLVAACGWQGGTIWQVIDEIRRLKNENEKLQQRINDLEIENIDFCGKLTEENESLRQEISKVVKNCQEFLASTFCDNHKDEVEKESFAEFLGKHVCERCVKESLAAKDKEIAWLKEKLQVAREALLTCEFPDEVEHVWWFDEDAVSNAIMKLEESGIAAAPQLRHKPINPEAEFYPNDAFEE